MTDLRQRLIARLVDERVPSRLVYGQDEPVGFESQREWAEHVADALLSLPGIAIVELPEQMTDRSVVAESIRNQPMWALNGAWASINDEGEIELEADGQMLCGALASPQDARDLAAVLLAAANAAEQETRDA